MMHQAIQNLNEEFLTLTEPPHSEKTEKAKEQIKLVCHSILKLAG